MGFSALNILSQMMKMSLTSFLEHGGYASQEIFISHMKQSRVKMSFLSFQSVQSLSRVQLFETLWTAARQASLSNTNSQNLLKLMSIESVIQPSHPLLAPSAPAFNLSQHQGLFQWVSSSHQVAKILEFHLQHQSFQWIFRNDFV